MLADFKHPESGVKNPFPNPNTSLCDPSISFSPIPQENNPNPHSQHLERSHSTNQCSAPRTVRL